MICCTIQVYTAICTYMDIGTWLLGTSLHIYLGTRRQCRLPSRLTVLGNFILYRTLELFMDAPLLSFSFPSPFFINQAKNNNQKAAIENKPFIIPDPVNYPSIHLSLSHIFLRSSINSHHFTNSHAELSYILINLSLDCGTDEPTNRRAKCHTSELSIRECPTKLN